MQPKPSLAELRKLDPAGRARLLEQVEKTASRNEINYWGCSQAVLDALQKAFGLESRDTFRAATAFAGGIASNQEACGALIGGVLALGLAYGRQDYEPGKVGVEQPDLVECSARARKYCDFFRQALGSLRCAEVRAHLGFDTGARAAALTPEAFRAHDKCGQVTGAAARLAAEVLLEPPELYADAVRASLEMMARLRKEL